MYCGDGLQDTSREDESTPGTPTAYFSLSGMDPATFIGLLAALCTTVSYIPQLRKCRNTGQTGDLSLKMFLTLAVGIALWIVYGVAQSDVVIILANTVSLCLLCAILFYKMRQLRREGLSLRQSGGTPARASD